MSEDGSASGAAEWVRLRPATQADWPMIRRWLGQPEVIRWWGPKSTSEAEVMLAMGSASALSRIIEADGDAVGYAHAIDAAALAPSLPPELPPGTWEIDLFVASPAHRGRGVGARALQLMRDEALGSTLALGVCARVAVGNERAVRAFEQAGFRWRAIVRDPVLGPEWLMVAGRV